MRCYDEIKDLYLAGEPVAAAALCESHEQELAADAAGCTLVAAVSLAIGRKQDSIAWLGRATALAPDSAAAWHNHGAALRQSGRYGEAAESFRQAVLLAPDAAESWFCQGDALAKGDRAEAALDCFGEALRHAPGHAGALAGQGLALHRLGRHEEALTAYEAALSLAPGDAETWLNMGVLYQDGGHTVAALSCYETALRLRPDFADAWSNRAKGLRALGRLDEATASFDKALDLRPEDPVLLLDRGMCRLLAGDFARGWADYEARLRDRNGSAPAAGLWPVWQGEDLDGRHILLTSEQGYGDTFQFMRYAAVLAGMGAEVTLHVPRAMLPVLGSLKWICNLTATVNASDRFDYQIALMSLPHRLGTVLSTIPAQVPYLTADAALASEWAARIGSQGFRVGIAWQGSPSFRDDAQRSIPLSNFLPLAEVPGVRLISLQRRDGLDQLAALPRPAAVETLPEPVDSGGAFLDTAAILGQLDLVITSDTALAHLAGALGRPVWLALGHVPDWRWLMSGEACPWYPTMRLFRQTRAGDWDGVFARIAEALGQHVATLAPATPMIPCSLGELIDKISILEIKSERIAEPEKLRYVHAELAQLRAVEAGHSLPDARLAALAGELKQVNQTLWDIEDALRQCEAEQSFEDRFIAFARAVYINNDRRAALKAEINRLSGSALMEQKSYSRAR